MHNNNLYEDCKQQRLSFEENLAKQAAESKLPTTKVHCTLKNYSMKFTYGVIHSTAGFYHTHAYTLYTLMFTMPRLG